MLLVGSSSMVWGLGPALVEELSALGVERVVNLAKTSTGLSRPDFFDWPAALHEGVAQHQPDMVLIHMGGNDPQHVRDRHGRRLAAWGSPAWREAYANRVRNLLAIGSQGGASVVVVGLPAMERLGYADRITEIDDILHRVTLERGALYIPTRDLTSHSSGAVRTTALINGRERTIRQEDGVHLASWAAPWMAGLIASRLAATLDLEATCTPQDPPP